MPMIKCPECGKEISDKAISCPCCGCPLLARDERSIKWNMNTKESVRQFSEKFKDLSGKSIAIFIGAVIFFIAIVFAPNGVGKDKAVLKKHLLNPSSLTIYEAHTNNNYGDGGRATLFYFGAENKAGGISDDWALVYDGNILFESNFNAAKDDGDNQGVLEHGELVFAKFAVESGSDKWKEVNIK